MAIPYRTRRAFKRVVTVLLALALVAVFILLCWLLWLDRFIVYTKDGAFFDLKRNLRKPDFRTAFFAAKSLVSRLWNLPSR